MLKRCMHDYRISSNDCSRFVMTQTAICVNLFIHLYHVYYILTFICLRRSYISYDLESRTVRSWRQNSVRCFSQCWPGNALRNRMCGGACCGRGGGREIIINAIRWGAWYYSIVLNACYVTSMADTGIDAVKHINDSVLSSLKMEGIYFIF
jgi:hypothetical protein